MAEFATAAAAIGISNLALTAFKNAHDFIQGMVKAPEQVKRIDEELKALTNLLQTIEQAQNLPTIFASVSREMNLPEVTEACAKSCDQLLAKLKKWMTDPEKPSSKERFRVRVHRDEIREHRNQIRDTKATVTLAHIIANSRLQVESLRQQGNMNASLQMILERDAERTVQESRQTALQIVRMDNEQDQEEEQETMELDAEPEDSGITDAPTTASRLEFEAMIEHAAEKAVLLSRIVVNQEFGKLDMQDQNDYDAGMVGDFDRGHLRQKFGDVKIGSQNKVRQGVFSSR